MSRSKVRPCLLAMFVGLSIPTLAHAQIGGAITELGSGGRSFNDSNPDIAYDPVTDVYAHVFEGFNSTNSSYSIRLKLFDAKTSAGISGGDIQIAGSSGKVLDPCVCYIAKSGMFLVAWQDDASGSWDIRCRAYDPVTKTASGTMTVAATAADEISPDLAGDATKVDDDAILVWDDENVGIRGVEIEVPSLAGLKMLTPMTLVSGAKPNNNNPAVSNSGGAGRHIALAYEVNTVVLGVEAYTMDLVAASTPLRTAFPNSSFPEVDGDGTDFVVVFQRPETQNANLGDIWTLSVRVPSSATLPMTLIAPPRALTAVTGQDEKHPAVAFIGSGYVAVWAITNANDQFGKCRVQPLTHAGDCGPGWSVQYANRQRTVEWQAIASQYNSDGDTADRKARFIYDTGYLHTSGPRSLCQKVNYEVAGGPKTSVAAGCGGGGTVAIAEPFAFGERITPALSGASNTAVISLAMIGTAASRVQFPCGTCNFLLGPISFPIPVSGGQAAWSVVIPCDATFKDVELDFQYIVLTPGTSPCPALSGFSASNILRGKVQ